MDNFENYDIIRVFDEKKFEKNVKKAIEKFGEKLGAVVKADAYGMGLKKTLPILKANGIKEYFCQDVIEALKTRKIVKEECNIYTLAGVQKDQGETFLNNKLIPICVSVNQIKYYNQIAKKQGCKAKFGIHFDTGMNRTGLGEAEVKELKNKWNEYTSNLEIVLYISHLHSSYDKGNKSNEKQLLKLKEYLNKLPKARISLSSTGGAYNLDDRYHFDIIRMGYGLYGMLKGMESVFSLYAKILQIKKVNKGETIGYFGAYKATKEMKIAIINIGYKDGYSRSLSKSNKFFDRIRAKLHSGAGFAKSYMYLGKYKCPVIGLISMNNTIIDISDIPDEYLKYRYFVEVVGEKANIMNFKEANGFVPCELICELTRNNVNAIDLDSDEFKIFQSKYLI